MDRNSPGAIPLIETLRLSNLEAHYCLRYPWGCTLLVNGSRYTINKQMHTRTLAVYTSHLSKKDIHRKKQIQKHRI